MEKCEEALELFEKALDIRQKALGEAQAHLWGVGRLRLKGPWHCATYWGAAFFVSLSIRSSLLCSLAGTSDATLWRQPGVFSHSGHWAWEGSCQC